MADKTTKAMLLDLLEKNFGPEQTFTLSEVYSVVEEHLQKARPNSNSIRHTIRQQLQGLKHDGLINFVDGKGTYTWDNPRHIEEAVVGTVYVLKDRQLGGYKIGISRVIKDRLKTLKVGTMADVVGLWDSPNYADLERMLHRRYKDCRVPQSEWFALSDDELADCVAWLDANADAKSKETVKTEKTISPRWSDFAIVLCFVYLFGAIAFVNGQISEMKRDIPPIQQVR